VSYVSNWARTAQREWLLRDFYTFAKNTVCPDIQEVPYREVCDWLESKLPNRKVWHQKFGILLMPRLTFKTSLIAALCLYAFLRDDKIRIILGRANTQLSQATLYGIKLACAHPAVTSAFGNIQARFAKWTDEFITLADRTNAEREPTVDTTGLNSTKTGAHQDLVILDDLVNEQNYDSPPQMEAARRLVQAFTPILERWGSLLVVGTRWGDNDLYGWLMQNDDELIAKGKQPQFDRYIRGAWVDDGTGERKLFAPYVLSEEHLEQLKDHTESKMFSAWYLNEPRAEGEDIFSPSYITYIDGDYVGGPFCEFNLDTSTAMGKEIAARLGTDKIPLAICMLVDPAPTVGRYSDFTGIVIVGFDPHGNYWVLHAQKYKLMPSARLDEIVFLASRYRPRLCALENADLSAPMLEEKLKALGIETEVVSFDPRLDRKKITSDPRLSPRGRTKKAAQIEALEPILKAKRVFFARGRVAPLVQQLTGYPYLDHDDVLDAFSMSRAYEQKMVVSIDNDPLRVYQRMEEQEYLLEGLDPRTGKDIDSPDRPKRWGEKFGRLYNQT
jgi:phage terminase large subunit-like protein